MDNTSFMSFICNSINAIFYKLFSSIDLSIYSNLDNILFIKPTITNEFGFQQLFGTDSNNGLLLLANSLIFGIVLFYSFKYVLSHLIYSRIDSIYQFLFKCIIFITCVNSSLWICEGIIQLFSIITDYICEIGNLISGKSICFSNLVNTTNSLLYCDLENFDIFCFDGILKLLTEIAIIYILIIYSIRYIICKLLILLSPFAILSLINNSFDGFFKGWLKQFIMILFSQILVSLLLTIGFLFTFSENTTFSKIIFLALLIVITKCKTYVKELFQNIHNYSNNKLKYFT